MNHSSSRAFIWTMVEVAKAAVWKLALIVLPRQTTDPWMNAIEGRVFVESGSTVRGRQRALQQLPYMGFSGAWPASWPTGVALQLHITEGDDDHEIAQTLAATVPNAELFVDRRRGALLHRRAVDFPQALVGDEFRPPGVSYFRDDWAMCCASPSPR